MKRAVHANSKPSHAFTPIKYYALTDLKTWWVLFLQVFRLLSHHCCIMEKNCVIFAWLNFEQDVTVFEVDCTALWKPLGQNNLWLHHMLYISTLNEGYNNIPSSVKQPELTITCSLLTWPKDNWKHSEVIRMEGLSTYGVHFIMQWNIRSYQHLPERHC